MESFKSLFEEIARERKSLVLSIYFEPRNYANPAEEMQLEQQRLQEQMNPYQNPSIIEKRIKPEETQLVLNSPESVDSILKEVSQGYKGMVYDVFLADDSGQPFGRAWELYNFMRRIDGIEGLLSFYTEIALSSYVPESLRPKLTQEVRSAGILELKNKGLEDKITEWESIFD